MSGLTLQSTESSEDVANVFNVALPLTSHKVAMAFMKYPVLNQSGWLTEVAETLLPYWNHKTELTIEQRCLL